MGAGLIFALIWPKAFWTVVALFTGVVTALDFQTNLVTGLAGYMGRSLLEKNRLEDDKK